jgi:hypothetical protein
VCEGFVGILGSGEFESGKGVHIGGATPVAFLLGLDRERCVLGGGCGAISGECDFGGAA